MFSDAEGEVLGRSWLMFRLAFLLVFVRGAVRLASLLVLARLGDRLSAERGVDWGVVFMVLLREEEEALGN